MYAPSKALAGKKIYGRKNESHSMLPAIRRLLSNNNFSFILSILCRHFKGVFDGEFHEVSKIYRKTVPSDGFFVLFKELDSDRDYVTNELVFYCSNIWNNKIE